MKEVLHFAASDQAIGAIPEVITQKESELSVTGGVYQDPDPNRAAWLFKSRRFKNPIANIEATLMEAFKTAGLVKTVKEVQAMAEPLGRSGLIAVEGQEKEQAGYIKETENNDFMSRREEELFLEMHEGNTIRNDVLSKVMKQTAERMALDKEGVQRLRAGARKLVGEHGRPPVAEIIAVMVGISDPKDPGMKIAVDPPELTDEMALDVYWLMLREEIEAREAQARLEQPA